MCPDLCESSACQGILTRIRHRYRFDRDITESSPYRRRYNQHDRTKGADDDGVEDSGLFEGSPPEVADWLREEARGGHFVRWDWQEQNQVVFDGLRKD